MMKLVAGEVDAGHLVTGKGTGARGGGRRLRSSREMVVMCVSSSSSSASLSTSPQSPLHAITHPASIDLRWYLNSHCKPGILPIFAPILPNAESVLFSEVDNRIRAQSSSSLNAAPAVGMLKFVTITTPCLVCGVLCDNRCAQALILQPEAL
jgi:hypothetical protein